MSAPRYASFWLRFGCILNRFARRSTEVQNGGMKIPETGTRCRVLWEDIVEWISRDVGVRHHPAFCKIVA
jgi:hypothetical protein